MSFFIIIFNIPAQGFTKESPENYKLIRIVEADTTGNGIKDKIEILADEKNEGYIVDIVQHNGKKYRLRSNNKYYNYIATYAPFLKLNILFADVNSDKIPEIITWGSLSHENNIYIYQWNGKDYKIIFNGFYWGFSFKDITGDKIPELVINNRITGTGFERIYFQWQKNKYRKIYYEMDAGRGFDNIKDVLTILNSSETSDNSFHPEFLKETFTMEWINNMDNIQYIKHLKSQILSIQLLEYLDEKLEWNPKISDIPLSDKWRIKVLIFKLNGTKIVPQEKILEVTTKQIEIGVNQYKINEFRIY